MQEIRRIDTTLLNKAARKIVGTNVTTGTEITLAPSDIRGVYDHFAPETANILDRAHRAKGFAPQEDAKDTVNRSFEFLGKGGDVKSMQHWERIARPGLRRNSVIPQAARPVLLVEQGRNAITVWEIARDRAGLI